KHHRGQRQAAGHDEQRGTAAAESESRQIRRDRTGATLRQHLDEPGVCGRKDLRERRQERLRGRAGAVGPRFDEMLSKCWGFAAAQAFARLEEMTYSFDFRRLAGNATYIDIAPSFLVEIIDGFLGEGDDVVPQGSRRNLLECRELLTSRIQVAFDEGL